MKYPLLVMKYGDFIREQIIENNAVGASLVGAPKNNREQRAGTRPAPTDANIRSFASLQDDKARIIIAHVMPERLHALLCSFVLLSKKLLGHGFSVLNYLLFQNTGVKSNRTAKNSRRPTSIWNMLNHFTPTGRTANESIGP